MKIAPEWRSEIRTGPDFQNFFVFFQIKQLCHERDNVRLRNGLSAAYRQRVVVVGLRIHGAVNEKMARHFAERIKHPFVRNAFAAERFDKTFSGFRSPVFHNACY